MKKGFRNSVSDNIFYAIDWILLILVFIIVAYPLAFIITSSFNRGISVMGLSLIPQSFTLGGYQAVFGDSNIWTGYANSILYMVAGTAVSLFVTICCAYPLSRKDFVGKKGIMLLCVFTMYFSGGLVPSYLLVQDLRLADTIWALILPGAMSVYNMIVMRTFFQSQIPDELHESSQIDGCGNIRFLVSIVLPLSVSMLSVIGLFYAVRSWNSYFPALIYLTSRSKYPLQIFLREILILNAGNSGSSTTDLDPDLLLKLEERKNVMKYSLIIVSSLPVLIIYPFVQKYFVKGIMIGAIKG
jgi:putative aldouronate transport system permease protein